MTVRQSLQGVRGCVAVGFTITAVAFAAYWWGNGTLFFSHGDARWKQDMLNEGLSSGQLVGTLARDFRSGLGVWSSPSFLISDLASVFGMLPTGRTYEPIYAAVNIASLYTAGAYLSRTFFDSRFVARLSGVALGYVLFMPTPFMWSRVPLQGNFVLLIAGVSISFAGCIRVSQDRDRDRNQSVRLGLVISFGIFLAVGSWGLWNLVVAPAWFLLGLAFLAINHKLRERKVLWGLTAWGLASVAVLSASAQIIRLVSNTASVAARDVAQGVATDSNIGRPWLFDDVYPISVPGTNISIYAILISLLIFFSIFILCRSDEAAERSFGRVSAAVSVGCSLYSIAHFLGVYWGFEIGPSPGYLALLLVPIWIVGVCRVGLKLSLLLYGRLRPSSPRTSVRQSETLLWRQAKANSVYISMLLAIWLLVWMIDNRDLRHATTPYPVPIGATSTWLHRQLTMTNRDVFDGRVFLLQNESSLREEMDNQVIYPTARTKTLRSELVEARVPVLNTYSHLISVRFARATNFWFTDGRPFVRLWSSFNKFDQKMAEMLGVRFVVSEVPLSGSNILQSRIIDGDLIYQIAKTNLGDFSPVNPVQIEGLADPLEYMASSEFDPRVDVLVEESLEQLVPAVSSSMTAERGRVTVDVETRGRSLLVLPIEFSTCMKLVASPVSAKVMRVNYLLTGLLVEGSGRFEIDVRMNPYFQRTSCF